MFIFINLTCLSYSLFSLPLPSFIPFSPFLHPSLSLPSSIPLPSFFHPSHYRHSLTMWAPLESISTTSATIRHYREPASSKQRP